MKRRVGRSGFPFTLQTIPRGSRAAAVRIDVASLEAQWGTAAFA